MTEIAVRDEQTSALAVATPITIWAESARQAANVAVSLAKTPFVPQSLRDRDAGVTAANITAAILTGQELGLEPMAALRSIDVIQGTPALRAIALRAVVLAAGHELWLAESTQTRAIVRGRRKGADQVQESTWTLDRAKALGLSSKDNWRKQPGAMLIARATAECARLVAADALLGVPYTAEELYDGDEQIVPSAVGPQADEPRRTARRRTAPAPAQSARPPVEQTPPVADPEPDFEPSGLDEFHADTTSNPEPPQDEQLPISEPDEPTITSAQQKMLHALLNENDMGDRDTALAWISVEIGRGIDSSKDLTKAEASRVVDALIRLRDGAEHND